MKKPVAKSKKKGMTKADFVRSLPADTPAREVVERARAAGVGEFTEHYVHNIRSLDRGVRVGRAGAAGAAGEGGDAQAAEDLLRAIALEMGISKAIAFLEEERRRIHAMIGKQRA